MSHTHHYQGQTLRHAHEGGENQHGYYEHPEDFPKVPAGEGEYEPPDSCEGQDGSEPQACGLDECDCAEHAAEGR